MYLDVNSLSLHVTIESEKCWEILRAFGTSLVPLGLGIMKIVNGVLEISKKYQFRFRGQYRFAGQMKLFRETFMFNLWPFDVLKPFVP